MINTSYVFFPAISDSCYANSQMIDCFLRQFDGGIICRRTEAFLACPEAICGIHDAFSAACDIGLIDSLAYTFAFSEATIEQLTIKQQKISGDSLSLSVFILLILATQNIQLDYPIAVTGAIHLADKNFVCEPVHDIQRKFLLAKQCGFSVMYLPYANKRDVSVSTHPELVFLPEHLPELIQTFMYHISNQ